MVTSGAWNAVDPKDAQTLALATKVNELSSTTTKSNHDGNKHGPIADWRKKSGAPVIERDGLTWCWCEHHTGKDYNGLCVRHTLENCRNKKKEKFRRNKKDNTKQPEPTENKQNIKLTLQKGLETALLTMGTFTEDQVDSILQETQEHLPKDF